MSIAVLPFLDLGDRRHRAFADVLELEDEIVARLTRGIASEMLRNEAAHLSSRSSGFQRGRPRHTGTGGRDRYKAQGKGGRGRRAVPGNALSIPTMSRPWPASSRRRASRF